jgi:alpha-L-arabinofuranosidase
VLAGTLLAAALAASAQPARISVAVDRPGHQIPPTLWGIFFEDINLSADGGIYPEQVRNRSFEDADVPEHWTITGANGSIDQSKPLNPFNRKSLRLQLAGAFRVVDEGYWGMNIIPGEDYAFRLAARGEQFNGPLEVRLVGASGLELASGRIAGLSGDWRYHTLELHAAQGDPKAKLEIQGTGNGTLFLDMVSLLPRETWRGHGLRVDLAEALNQLHPKFMRFPGGCWVEGDDLAHLYHWKNTVGNVDTRTPLWNIWGYNATHGLGFHEYLQLAEDLGAEPLFCINVGMSHRETVPADRLAQWVQDALDALEYANGPTDTVWGGLRASAGHPAPFHLKYLEIGNENGGFKDYVAHWAAFYKAIKQQHPGAQLVADGWNDFGPQPPDIVDDHYYDSPEWFMRHAHDYDHKDRHGPKVFVGEYAVTRNCGLGNLRGAIGEAVFMTGLERNSDVVVMASYAPLFVNLNHRAWTPDLINFDSSRWYGLPSYYVQKMFSENRGDVYLPTEVQAPAPEAAPPSGMVGVGTWNTAAEFKEIKVAAPDGQVLFASDFSSGTKGWKLLGDGANWTVQNGSLRQEAQREFIRALAGQRDWTNYTVTLKARKLSGAEGFLILFHINGDEDRTWWNIGGWGNTQNALEVGGILDPKPGRIEENRWYDIKVSVSGAKVACYLDGQLIHDVTCDPGGGISSLYATAATETASGDLIVKVVNTSLKPLETELALSGAKSLSGAGTATVLTSENPTDENSLEHPTRVSPKTENLSFHGASLTRSFPGNSLTVLRLKTSQ